MVPDQKFKDNRADTSLTEDLLIDPCQIPWYSPLNIWQGINSLSLHLIRVDQASLWKMMMIEVFGSRSTRGTDFLQ